ncbi:MAG: hypothetical protein KAI66_12700 [Lentisphaeria bacterium]|nr:hypothetical protein [Lentisphaeria bacterium]
MSKRRKRIKRLAKIGWRSMRGGVRLLIVFIGVLLALALVLDLWCEWRGLPKVAREFVSSALSQKGLRIEFSRARGGLFRDLLLDDVVLVSDDGQWPFRFTCDTASAEVSLNTLLRGEVTLDTIQLNDGMLELKRRVGKRGSETITCFEGLAVRVRNRGTSRTSLVTIDARTEGVHVSVRGVVRNVPRFALRRLGNGSQTAQGPPGGPRENERDKSLGDIVAEVARMFRERRFGGQEATLHLRFDTDLQNVDRGRVTGSCSLADVMVRRQLVQKLKVNFHLDRNELHLKHLDFMLGGGEHLSATATVHFADHTISGEFEGSIAPVKVYRLLGQREPAWLQHAHFMTPPRVRVLVKRSPLDVKQLSIEASCTAHDLRFKEAEIQAFDIKGRWADGIATIDNMHLTTADGGKMYRLQGEGTVWTRSGELEGEVEGEASLLKLVTRAGLALPAELREISFREPPVVKVRIERSRIKEWPAWKGAATVSVAQARFRDQMVRDLAATLAFSPQRVELQACEFLLGRTEALRIETTASVALGSGDDPLPKTMPVDFTLKIHAEEPDEQDARQEALADFAGRMMIDSRRKRLSARAKGRVFPRPLYRAARAPLGLPDSEIANDIVCHGDGLDIDVELPECPLSLRGWKLQGTVNGRDASYSDIRLVTVTGAVSVDAKEFVCTGIKARTDDGKDLNLDLQLVFEPLLLSITKIDISGDPRIAKTFIKDREARNIYLKIWEDFTWGAANRPRIRVKELVYEQGKREADWTFRLDGTIEAENLTYRSLQVDNIAARVRLDLPGSVTIDNVRLETGETVLHGNIAFRMSGTPTCEFTLSRIEGGYDPQRLLNIINPEWENLLDPLKFSPDTTGTCTGSFFLSGDSRLALGGRISVPKLTLKMLEFENVDATWRIDSGIVAWDADDVALFDGKVNCTGTYDTYTRTGLIAVQAEEVDLRRLGAAAKLSKMPASMNAKLGCSFRVQYLNDWAGTGLTLTGNGKLKLNEGDLWKVPVLGKLGELLDVSLLSKVSGGRIGGLGKITSLDADLEFKGRRVVVPRLYTNGTIMSLKGSGEYSWETERLYFDIGGETFRKVGLLSFVLKPLSWVFNAELSGTLDNHKWTMNNALRRALLGGISHENRAVE